MSIKRCFTTGFCVFAMSMLVASTVFAKRGSIAIYAIVDKVVFEPDEQSPKRVRIWGTFVVPAAMSSGEYRPVQRGHLYFTTLEGVDEATRLEWFNLQKFAGTGQCVGFGQYWVPNPLDEQGNPHHSLEARVRRDEDESRPDEYPLPHERGIMLTGDKSDPDFEKIADDIRRVARD